jgi:hypothetical protein
MRVYVDNCVLGRNITKKKFWEDVRAKAFTDPQVRERAVYNGSDAQTVFHRILLDCLNKRKFRNKYVHRGRTGKEEFRLHSDQDVDDAGKKTGNGSLIGFAKNKLSEVLPERKSITYKDFITEYVVEKFPDRTYSSTSGSVCCAVDILEHAGLVCRERLGKETLIIWTGPNA